MSTKYDAFKDDFEMNLKYEIQQAVSFLSPCCTQGRIEGENLYTDFIDAFEANEIVGRNQDTINNEPDYSRRRVQLKRFNVAPLLDKADMIYLMDNPQGEVLENCKRAINRSIDNAVYAAFDATVETGRSGAGSQTFDSNNVVTAASGLTFAKLLEAKTLLDNNSLGAWEMDEHFLACTPNQIANLLSEEKVTSSDYAAIKALVNGEINSFMGFNFVKVPTTTITASAGVRKCFAFAKRGVFYGVASDLEVRVDDREDKNYSTQIFVEWMGNALRHYEELVIRIDSTES
jgi:hypothetical protein